MKLFLASLLLGQILLPNSQLRSTAPFVDFKMDRMYFIYITNGFDSIGWQSECDDNASLHELKYCCYVAVGENCILGEHSYQNGLEIK